MRRLVAAVGAAVVAASFTLVGEGAAAAQYCEPVAVFGLGGHGDPAGDVYGPNVRKVRYSASIWPFGSVTYDDSVREGRDNMVAAVNSYAEACGGHIVVKGYSEGARAAGDALEILDDGPHARRISGVLYADPKRPGGVEHALRGVSVVGISMTGPRAGFNVPVRSVCNANDAVCNFPLWSDPIRAVSNIHGYLNGGHRYNVND
ncbi:cutinase family protein [Nocardia farcinica]|uniref:cutinase family protein n=1 Tax=Nocardia farcinica TaxID=37329 RepID=UPI000E1BF358|nr:PE-PPE domain-containing protein [Nocardia farcinica]